jgi:hypothetical protein
MELTDRSIVITGAGSGIGRAVAERFAAESPRALVLADIDLPSVQAVAKEVGGVAVKADVSREEDILALVAQAREVAGPIDVFFSNAGIGGPPGGPEAPDEEWQRAWQINTMAHIWAARAVLPEMLELCPLGVRTPMLEEALGESVGAAALMSDELLEPADVAEAVVAGIRDERFLIYPHPQVAKYVAFKGADNERWLAGMRRMVKAARDAGAAD